MGLLLLAVLAVFSLLAHLQVRRALTEAVEARLVTASDRLATMIEQSMEGQAAMLRSLVRSADLDSVLRTPTAARRAAAAVVLDSAVAASEARLLLALYGRDGSVVASGDSAAVAAVVARAPAAGLGPLMRLGDTLIFARALPVVAGTDTLGRLVDVVRLGGNPGAAEAVADLVGNDATFLLGSPGEGVWTDLAGAATGPPADVLTGRLIAVRREGARELGLLGPVRGTPWMQWVAVPEAAALAPLRWLMPRMTTVVVLLVLAGVAGAWLLGRWLTRPLARLTAAAEAIAGGDYSRRVRSERHDEIGRLGDAFDSMAAKVEESRERLEHRVAERTAELRTALKDLEETQDELVRKERLALLGELAGGVGHELRNPLGVMTNAVFYLRAVLKDAPQDVEEYLDILARQVHISEKIVSDLLDFARVKEPQRRRTDVAALAEQQLDRAAPPETVEVVRDFAPDLPAADIDPDQVAQVVLNLLTNAVQAMEESGGGVLTIRTAARDGRVELEVRDTGQGIPPEVAAKIFEPLFTTKPRGIGLGLSVSRSLAEANAGRLELASTGAGGTAFVLALPRVDA